MLGKNFCRWHFVFFLFFFVLFFFLVFPENRVWHAIRYFMILPREAKVNYRNLICSLVTQEYGIFY